MLKSLFRQLLGTNYPRPHRAGIDSRDSPAARSPASEQESKLKQGMKCQKSGQLGEAERIYRSILEIEPARADALHLLGHVLQLQGKVPEAIDVFSRLTSVAPQSAAVRFSLAGALLSQRRLPEAAQRFREALELQPDLLAALESLADILAVLRQADEAEKCYERALQLKPDADETHMKHGNLLLSQGRIPEAMASYRRALDVNPGLTYAHSNLIVVMGFDVGSGMDEQFAERRRWQERHVRPLGIVKPRHSNKIGRASCRERVYVLV